MSAALMVQGVSSDAGKSLVATALCRWLRRRGVRVAPFKAQNMSNNARVVDGGEMGTAQWLQALAAGVEPDVRMNPILLKPESDTRSQVVLNGVADLDATRRPWRGRSESLWPHVERAFSSLRDEFDVLVIEGAGSPAETNLWPDDIVNMRVADLADAPVLLVADIDRGGAFAHLYGTWALLEQPWQARVEGFLLNKFRGDVSLLDPAPADLEGRTGVPTVGVLPWMAHALPDEEGPTEHFAAGRSVGLVCGPYASNLDEFVALQQVARVDLVRRPEDLRGVELVILPGSKHVAADLAWMRGVGLVDAVVDAVSRGIGVLGICGGLQLLGRRIEDPHGVEGAAAGLGLLDVDTTLARDKHTARTHALVPPMPSPWEWLGATSVDGYEIRHGRTTAHAASTAVVAGDTLFIKGNVAGTTLHGLFENRDIVERFAGRAPATLDAAFDALADAVDRHFDTSWLEMRTSR